MKRADDVKAPEFDFVARTIKALWIAQILTWYMRRPEGREAADGGGNTSDTRYIFSQDFVY